MNLDCLSAWLKTKDVERMLDFFFVNKKLASALDRFIVLKGSTGNQVVKTEFDRARFRRLFKELIEASCEKKEEFGIGDLFNAYNDAYFLSTGNGDFGEERYFVNKCPEKGDCIQYYLDNFPGSRILHIIRDPRASIASHKAELSQKALLPYGRFFQYISIANDALNNYSCYAGSERVHCMRYEDLVLDCEGEMRRVAGFLGIPFEEILLKPTILGESWKSNTSFKSEVKSASTSIFSSNIDKFKKRLNPLEIQCIEALCAESMAQRGYDAIYAKADINKLKPRYMAMSALCARFYLNRVRNRVKRLLGSSRG